MILTHRGTLLAVFGLFLAACSAPRDPLPGERTAVTREEDLIERNVAARGGLARLQAIESLTVTGTVVLPGMSLSMPLVMHQKRPSRILTEVEAPGMGTFVTGYDGSVAWTINPTVGRRPQRLRGPQEREVTEQADFDGLLLTYREKGYRAEYAGETTVRDRRAHRLRLLRPDGSQASLYLDATTHLVVKTEGEGINPMTNAAARAETYFSDFREVSGVTMPFAVEVAYDGEVFQRITFTDVEVNPDLDDSIFALPSE